MTLVLATFLILLGGNFLPAFAQQAICCNQLVSVGGNWIGASRTPFVLYYRSDRIQGGRADGFPNSLAGWSLDVHHAYEIDRSILYTGDGKRRIAKATGILAGAETRIPSEDGALVYVFDAKGRHMRTANGLSGTLQRRFLYDNAGGLVRIEDDNGNVTRIERDGKGAPTAIVAPGGQRTMLITNRDGFLAAVPPRSDFAISSGAPHHGR